MEENLELTNAQSDRVDEVYNAVFELCKTMTEDENLEWDMSFIGDIADYAAETLHNHEKRVHFPSIVTNEDDTQFIEEYYMEGAKSN